MKKKLFKELWTPFEWIHNHSIYFQIGPLDLWIIREPNEWKIGWLYHQRLESRLLINKKPELKNIKMDWKRWIAGEKFQKITLKPVFPDRSVIVRPELPISLLPGESAMFFVGVPCFISICVGDEEKSLSEIPSSILSNTWSGENTVTGELCYGLRTTAKRDHEDLLEHFHRITCPIQIKNESTEILNFERLCLPVRYLSTYLGESKLWGNMERVVFLGKGKWGRIVSSLEGPNFDHANTILSKPREFGKKGILFNAFNEFVPLNYI